uniref:F-actin-capping protein subunit alpha n=1 Tax=Rodentolepis nana TaxID=102285 RepID=A0A0R3TEC5_RODNA
LDEMSTKSVKALRRQLPMSRDKMDWNKLASYQVGNELTRLSCSIGASAAAAATSSTTSTS